MSRIIRLAGVLTILAMGTSGVTDVLAGADANQHATGKLTNLDSQLLLEGSPFEPSRETWTRIAGTSDASTDLGLLAHGALALAAGELDAARQSFEAARVANCGSPYPYYYLARIELDHGSVDTAIQYLQESVRLRRDFAAAYQLLGRAYIEIGANHQGFSALRTVIALAPGQSHSHLALGRAYLENGRPAHAIVELQRANELNPDPLESLYLLGRARLNAGLVEEGFADLEAYVAAATGILGETVRLSRALLLLQRFAGGSI